jgi:uncharacterized protein (TIGR02569 family)
MAAPRSRSVLTPGVEVRPSPIEGLGLFAARAFAAGEVVAVLGGRVVDDAGWAEATAGGQVSGYAIGEGRHLVQDEDDPARFGNHSCDPTTWLVDEVTLVARRPVATGEELTSDYATLTDDPAWALSCRCGAAECRGWVTGVDHLRPELRRRYAGHLVPFLERRVGPPAAVLAGFGLDGDPERLPGGQGVAFRIADTVVKPVRHADEAAWAASVLGALPQDGFRVAPSVAARDGRWVVDGWAAWRWVEGRATRHRWTDVVAVGRRFTAALAPVPPPALLRARQAPWPAADQAAWGERSADVPEPLRPLVERLMRHRRPVDLPVQLVHGDLTGNVLFADDLPPAVIDLSPYVRPATYPLAVVVVDALAWHGADEALVRALDDDPESGQLLLRAALFRLYAAAHFGPAGAESEARAFAPVVELLERLQSRP